MTNRATHFCNLPAAVRSRGVATAEVLLGLLVLVLAGTLLLAGLGRLRQHARLERCAEDFRGFAAVLEKYRAENGRWPPTAQEVARLAGSAWRDGSPFGGHYGWVPPKAADGPAVIALTAFAPDLAMTLTRADLLDLDRRLDDGDPATGHFRTGFNGWPVYRVGNKP